MNSASKRKRLKTRKCLDELRKRSYKKSRSASSSKEVEELNNVITSTNYNCITAGRLTLTMFPKTVRSATVTRPALTALSEIKHEVNISSKTKNFSCTNIASMIPINGDSQDENIHVNEHVIGISSGGNETDRSFQLASDLGHSSPGSLTVSGASTSCAQSQDYRYNLYQEFMSGLSLYLKKTGSTLLNEDVKKQTKALLHNIYIEGCRKECENNLMNCIKNNTVHSIVQNPMDYLRLGYSWQSAGAGTPPSTCSSAQSPLLQHSIIQDSPEYTYYAHKLNK